MKRSRKIKHSIVALICLVAMMQGVVVFADQPTKTANDASTYAMGCGSCETGVMVTTTRWGNWQLQGFTKCTKNPRINDDIQKRNGLRELTCGNCSRGSSTAVSETRTICNA